MSLTVESQRLKLGVSKGTPLCVTASCLDMPTDDDARLRKAALRRSVTDTDSLFCQRPNMQRADYRYQDTVLVTAVSRANHLMPKFVALALSVDMSLSPRRGSLTQQRRTIWISLDAA
jgi:hypothetical protein